VTAVSTANTLLLTASAAVTAWCAADRPAPAFRSLALSPYGPALLLVVVTSMTGAVTALGDTLFPTHAVLGSGLFDKVRGDLGAANHFLIRLRAVHPVVAILTAGWLLKLTAHLAFSIEEDERRTWARWAFTAVAAEVCLGLLNIALAAPGWLQLAHLLVAQALWVTLLLTGVAALSGDRARRAAHRDLGEGAVGRASA